MEPKHESCAEVGAKTGGKKFSCSACLFRAKIKMWRLIMFIVLQQTSFLDILIVTYISLVKTYYS